LKYIQHWLCGFGDLDFEPSCDDEEEIHNPIDGSEFIASCLQRHSNTESRDNRAACDYANRAASRDAYVDTSGYSNSHLYPNSNGYVHQDAGTN
jgi:hypothetical protein